MAVAQGGACAQLQGGLCAVHRDLGLQEKPSGCRRFPFGLISTPDGGRITTEHRCPCRTLGERPPIDLEEAARSLSTTSGRLEPDHWIVGRIPVAAGRTVSYERYAKAEGELILALLRGEPAESVLGAEPLPPLHAQSWASLAATLYDLREETANGAALSWFADALLFLAEGLIAPARPRPWAPAFETAIGRCAAKVDPDTILNDWIADELWMMRWQDWSCSFDVARAELATRLAVARRVIALLTIAGVRPDQAAAEAVLIGELGACNDQWPEVVDAIANDPSPAPPLD
jgi:hypothetical protein